MRNVTMLLMLFGLLLTGCNNDASRTSTQLIVNETVLYPENEPPSLQIKKEDGNWEEISSVNDYPSKPEINSDKTKLAFISPFEFEMAGEVWFYNTASTKKEKVFSQEQAGQGNSAKAVIWIDNDNLLILAGNTVGTITSSRTLYILSTKDNKLQEFFQAESNQDIRDLTLSDGTSLSFNLATYNEDSTDFQLENKMVDITKYLSTE